MQYISKICMTVHWFNFDNVLLDYDHICQCGSNSLSLLTRILSKIILSQNAQAGS